MKCSPSSTAAAVAGCLVLAASSLGGVAAVSQGGLRLPYSQHPRSWRYQKDVRRRANEELGTGNAINSTQLICQNPAPLARAVKQNVWGGLTDVETASVLSWLFSQKDLNLTAHERSSHGNLTAPPNNTSHAGPQWLNTVVGVELLQPNKSDVLSYLDGHGAAPARYARVVVDNRTSHDPFFWNILVGPLPIDNKTTTWTSLEYPFTKKSGGKVRNIDTDPYLVYSQWIMPVAQSIANITQDLWNATASLEPDSKLFILPIDPLWQDDGRVKRWDSFIRVGDDIFDVGTLLPQGLYFKSDITGRDPTKWKLEGWLYNDNWYDSTEAFQKAYWSPGFERIRGAVDGPWTQTDRQGDPLPLDTTPPPVSSASAPPRFSVDVNNKYVEWMGFSFYLGFTADTGLSLYDVRYEGQRILYELGLQEALAHYAGNEPFLSNIAYLDTFYGFGRFTFELVAGFDCPQYATFLNSSFYSDEVTHTHPNSICLFEFDEKVPLQRHTTDKYVSITKNTQLVVRTVATVGNYDYSFSYSFALDGSIGIDVHASGYIQSAFASHNEQYGFKIQDGVSGAMHDHVLNFKADFDVLGTANSVQKVSSVPVSKVYPWSGGKVRNTMGLERKFVDNEDQAKIDWDANSATQLLVVNKAAKNRHGEYRGWRIQPTSPGAHLTVANSSSLVHAAHWAEHDVHFTRRKDTEPRSSNPYQNQDVHDPPVNFARFSDGESLDQTDLVAWVNLGMHHVPTTGDLPNTVTTTAHAGVRFVPSNYFEGDVSRRSRNTVRINYEKGAVLAVENSERGHVCEADFWNYRGDVSVRKYPFDPNNPYYETESIS